MRHGTRLLATERGLMRSDGPTDASSLVRPRDDAGSQAYAWFPERRCCSTILVIEAAVLVMFWGRLSS
jgi:hypothetical protein